MEIKVCKLGAIKTADGSIINVGVETPEPKLPAYGKEGDACMDIYPIYCEYDDDRDRWIYHTGLAFAIGETNGNPNEMEIRPRSNLTKSNFYMPNSPGTLDFGYRGELLIIFKNRTDVRIAKAIDAIAAAIQTVAMMSGCIAQVNYHLGAARTASIGLFEDTKKPPYKCDGEDRCCQIVIRGREEITWNEVKTVEELGTSERGAGGFGSTGGAVK